MGRAGRPVVTETRNGIRRPADQNNARGRIWAVIDRLVPDYDAPLVPWEALATEKALAGVSKSYIRVEYSRWLRFHGRGRWRDARI